MKGLWQAALIIMDQLAMKMLCRDLLHLNLLCHLLLVWLAVVWLLQATSLHMICEENLPTMIQLLLQWPPIILPAAILLVAIFLLVLIVQLGPVGTPRQCFQLEKGHAVLVTHLVTVSFTVDVYRMSS